jgi:hypothetical protein
MIEQVEDVGAKNQTCALRDLRVFRQGPSI